MSERVRIAVAGGGTGGHVIPAIAVARELERRGYGVTFIGTQRGLESRLVPAAGFPIEWIEIGGLEGLGWARRLRTLAQLPVAVARCRSLLKGTRALFSMGGYVAGPPVLAALSRKIPVVAMEPNAYPGLTNRAAGRWLYRALVGLEEAAAYFPAGRVEVTGVPVREEFFAIRPRTETETFTVLLTGGSQGSRTLNRAFEESWPLFSAAGAPVRFLHQAGRASAPALAGRFAATGLAGQVAPFIDDMPAAFAQADLICGRSGASAVAELCAAGRASLLVPFPHAAGDHQARNAAALERAGASVVAADAAMTGRKLFDEVMRLASNRALVTAMGEAARKLAKPSAAARAAEIVAEAADL